MTLISSELQQLDNHNLHTYRGKHGCCLCAISRSGSPDDASSDPFGTHPKWVTSSVHKKGFVAHFPWQIHILLWLPLGSGGFILVARRTPHMVDVLCRPYQQNQAWNRGQGCPVMTEFIFLCPHVFSIWPSSKCSPSLHKPPGNSRKSYCTRLGLNVQREPLWLG